MVTSSSSGNLYSVNWKCQQNHVLKGLKDLQEDLLLTDVTLACDGEYISAHKLVLTLCSPFFKDLFKKNKADKSNAIIILGNVSALNLKYLLQFMYQGNVALPSQDVDSFLQAGRTLKIEGLTDTPISQTESKIQSKEPGPSSQSHIEAVRSGSDDIVTAIPNPGTFQPAPAKKRRLCEPPVFPVNAPMVVNPDVFSSAEEESPADLEDPLDSCGEYDNIQEKEVIRIRIKTEPVQEYSESQESLHSESVENDEDSLLGSTNGDSYPIPDQITISTNIVPSCSPVGRPSKSFIQGQQATFSGKSSAVTSSWNCNSTTKRKPTSLVYEYFNQLPFDGDESNMTRCHECRICTATVKCYGTKTSNLLSHLQHRHPDAHQKVRANMELLKQ